MVHLCKELFDSLLVSCPCLLNRRFMLSATKLRRQFSFSAEYNRHSFTWLYLDTKSAWLIHVLDVRQSSLGITTMLHTPEPFPSSSKLGRRLQNKHIGWSPFICADAAATSLIFYQKMPVGISMRCTMVIAIETERTEGQYERLIIRYIRRCGGERILNIGGVLSVFHPNALLKCSVFTQSIAKAGYICL